ncbi:hypothetical protein CLOSTASPAR_06781 [[Clostridium] asparagiforme DSM 15981]|uniref:Uncharacterized protein n=1 Tax=[Clostridium] asparagiforme DSM 15981 TaxID=518636 RepID=C0DBX4_9FIRM|nr:hypothetical protein CLOSTASPAR_06781 [[Clostridium] asparagiforme DSM 15981]
MTRYIKETYHLSSACRLTTRYNQGNPRYPVREGPPLPGIHYGMKKGNQRNDQKRIAGTLL